MKLSLSDQAQEATAGASEVLERLRAAFTLSARNNSDLVFYSRSRVKDPNSLVAKLFDRQQRYNEHYNLTDVTDIIGYRVVVLYDDQISEALDLTLNVLENCYFTEDKLIDSKNVVESVHEIKFFPRRNRPSDPYRELYDVFVKKFPNLESKKIKMQNASKTDYSSMHIILYMNSYSQGHVKKIPVEIQIRTAIEDVWSEISHKNKYKVQRPNVWSPDIENFYKENERTINIIKDHLDAGIPDQINDVRQTTKSINQAIADLRSTDVSGYDSTILNFVHLMSAGRADAPLRHAMDVYNIEIRKVRLRRSVVGFRRLTEFVGEISSHSENLTDKYTKLNIGYLMHFECLRLKAVTLKEAYEKASKRKLDNEQKADLDKIKKEAMWVYSEIDKLQLNPDMKLKPISLLEFWKFYICRYTNLDGHYLTHLMACASSLPIDPTIDAAHVLRYMVPRLLAYESWVSAEDDRKTIGDTKVTPPNITQIIRNGYADALRLALESRRYLENTPKSKSKDDLIYFRSIREKYICLNNVVLYAADCLTKGVGEVYFSEVGYGIQNLENDVQNLKKMADRARNHHEVSISHTLMIGMYAIGNKVESKIIAKRFKNSQIGGEIWKNLDHRIHEDVDMILN